MTDQTQVDAVVIGSGAGGGPCAWALAHRGVKVLLLDSGPAYDPASDYRLDRAGWERTRFPHKVPIKGRQSFAPLQKLDPRWDDLRSWNKVTGPYNRTGRRLNWGYHHVVGLGGSTLQFTGEAHRLHPDAFRMRSRFGVAADWPVTYADMEPYYLSAERLVGVAGPPDERVRRRSAPFPQPPHDLSYASQKIAVGCQSLGLTFRQNPRFALSQPFEDRPACNYCGGCNRGCPLTDKGSVDVTFIRKAQQTGNCRVMTGAHVTHVDAGANDRVAAVHYVDADGRSHAVTARAVVVACGAVETPRLLLNSSNSHAPAGLANESGEVGRHFMETLSWTASGLHSESLASYRGLPSDGICWDYNAPDAIPGVIGGCRFVQDTAAADLIGPINYARRVVGGWGRDHKKRLREAFGRALTIVALGESLPNPKSFIDLDRKKKDRHGLPLARIHSHVGDSDLKRLSFMAGKSRDILKASGVGDLVEEYGTYDTFNSTHVFGTCRMGHDAGTSVVDSFGRSHRWRNLFVADASLFPSSGGGEAPSLTIMALALRTGEHIAELGKAGAL